MYLGPDFVAVSGAVQFVRGDFNRIGNFSVADVADALGGDGNGAFYVVFVLLWVHEDHYSIK